MDETQWFAAASPRRLVAHLRTLQIARTKAGRRKLHLFACACSRRLAPGLRESQVAVIDQAERAADGLTDIQAVQMAWQAAYPIDLVETTRSIFSLVLGLFGVRTRPSQIPQPAEEPREVREMFWRLIRGETRMWVSVWRLAASPALTGIRNTSPDKERAIQAELLRCLVGNPFRPVAMQPSWRTETAIALAQGIRDDRAYDRLPVLADALEDAGCDDAGLLKHCRMDTIHAHGCHAVDLVLGR